jgi:hypothetical protein
VRPGFLQAAVFSDLPAASDAPVQNNLRMPGKRRPWFADTFLWKAVSGPGWVDIIF